MSKLIVLRGNSGSGKTSVAKELQKKFGHGTILISQDVVRREMLYVKDGENPKAEELIYQIAMYGKKYSDIIIVEGIFNSKWYNNLFKKLSNEFKDNIFAFYFNIPFEETLKRHKTKKESKEFGEKEMRQWWLEKDLLEAIPETMIEKELGLNEIVEFICKKLTN